MREMMVMDAGNGTADDEGADDGDADDDDDVM